MRSILIPCWTGYCSILKVGGASKNRVTLTDLGAPQATADALPVFVRGRTSTLPSALERNSNPIWRTTSALLAVTVVCLLWRFTRP